MSKLSFLIIALVLVVIPLYPKFPLVGVGGTFVSVRLEDFLLLGLGCIWFVVAVRTKFACLKNPVGLAIFTYLVIGFISFFSGLFLTKTVGLNQGLLHTLRRVEYMAMFFVAYDLFRQRESLGFLIRSLLVVSLVVSVFGIGQQFFGWPIISTTNSEFAKGLAVSLGPGARINSTFAGHYDLAAFSVLPVLLAISLLSLRPRYAWLLIAIAGLAYWTLLLSASRITFASATLCGLVLVWLIRKPWWTVPLVIISILGMLSAPQLRGRYLEFITNHVRLSLAPSVQALEPTSPPAPEIRVIRDVNTVPDALQPAAVPEDRSFNIRLQASWPRAIRAFLKNPVFGTGFSSVGLAVDSGLLRILAETGMMGLAAFSLIFFKFFASVFARLWHWAPSLESVWIATVSVFILNLFLNAVFIDIFEASKIAIITWTIMGVTQKLIALSK